MASSNAPPHIPAEIQDQICDALLEVCRQEQSPTAAYACVCPAWQRFFEARHFASICLTVPRVTDIGRFVTDRRRKLVTHIRLDAAFRSTDGDHWDERFGGNTNSARVLNCRHDFVYAIRALLLWLSTWNRSEDVSSQGLILELWAPWAEPLPRRAEWGHLPTFEPLMSPPILPEVDVVTTLLHRHSGFYQNGPDTLRQLMRSLPALEKIVYEQREILAYTEFDKCYEIMISELPASIKQLAVFEDIKDEFSSIFQPTPFGLSHERRLSLAISTARASRQLEHLALSFVVDAGLFFHHFSPSPETDTKPDASWTWPKLKTLALTAQLLRLPRESSAEINRLLEAASLAVRRMPKLLILEMWHGNSNQHGCVVRYHHDPDTKQASLTWHASWSIDITERAASSWKETVHQMTGLELDFRFEEMVFSKPLRTYWVARFLKLRDRVITPGMPC